MTLVLVASTAMGGILVAVAVIAARQRAFQHTLARRRRALQIDTAALSIEPAHLATLPAPLRRYAASVLVGSRRAPRFARLRHGGRFRANLDGGWMPIRGEECFAGDPPGFVWWGRVRVAPGVWIDARDESIAGVGRMLVALDSTITLADESGPALDQSALLRLLGELPILPAVLFDVRYVTWEAIDPLRAAATLHVADRSATGIFEFGADGLPERFRADRWRTTVHGTRTLNAWSGTFADYRPVEGIPVPRLLRAQWELPDRAVPYVDFVVDEVAFDATPG